MIPFKWYSFKSKIMKTFQISGCQKLGVRLSGSKGNLWNNYNVVYSDNGGNDYMIMSLIKNQWKYRYSLFNLILNKSDSKNIYHTTHKDMPGSGKCSTEK